MKDKIFARAFVVIPVGLTVAIIGYLGILRHVPHPEEVAAVRPAAEETRCKPCEEGRKLALPLRSAAIASAIVGSPSAALPVSRCYGGGYQSIHTGSEPLAHRSAHYPTNGNVDVWAEVGYDLPCIFYAASFAGCRWCMKIELFDCVNGNNGTYVTTSGWLTYDQDCNTFGDWHTFFFDFRDLPPLAAGHYYEAVFSLAASTNTDEACGDAGIVDTQWADSQSF